MPSSAAPAPEKPVETEMQQAENEVFVAEAKAKSHKLDYPNVITPNGDGKNEIFVVESDYILTLQVQVLDMSGKIVHQWNNLHGFWDGRLQNGEPAPEGKYLINIFAVREDGTPVHEPPLTLILKR
jgi:gliding motility-associated-like protein